MRRPMGRRLALVPVLSLFALALWWARPAGLPVPATIAMQATVISDPLATIAALQTRVAATPGATPAASPTPAPSPAAVPEGIPFRGSGSGVTAPVRMERGPVVVVVAYHGDGNLIVWLEHPAGERRPLVDEIGPWDGAVGVAIDDPGDYRFAVEADGGPWTIALEGSQEGRG
ncbi:MAG: hypothetical protein M3R02_02975 [Chloroflexota bacterium]|nr:hypothetical protein [Chloroflexota bacterium]